MSYIGNSVTTQGFVPAIDYFNGNGSTIAFTLSRPIASAAQVQAVIENVPQNPGSAFTVSGNTITFTSAPPSGTSNIYVYYTSPITQVITPSDGTVGTSALASNAVTTAKIADANITPAKLSQPLTLATAQNSTSGTSIDFTGIPSWVKRITVMLQGVSTTGTSNEIVQLGSGSVTTTGYVGLVSVFNGASLGASAFSAGFTLDLTTAATDVRNACLVFTLIGSNTWVCSGTTSQPSNTRSSFLNGYVPLSGTLDRVRITTVGGTDTFDAGSINILYEG